MNLEKDFLALKRNMVFGITCSLSYSRTAIWERQFESFGKKGAAYPKCQKPITAAEVYQSLHKFGMENCTLLTIPIPSSIL